MKLATTRADSMDHWGVCLHVFHRLDFGGVESHAKTIHLNREHSKFRHIFCAIEGGGRIAEELKSAGAEVHILGKPDAIPSRGAIVGLVKLFRSVRPHVVHLRGAEANFHGVIAARIAKIRCTVCEEIGLPRHSRIARWVFREIYRQCDGVVAISQAVESRLIELGEVDSGRVRVMHNPVQLRKYRPMPNIGGRLQLGFVGRLERIKNPLAAVHAVEKLRSKGLDARVRIIGEGSLRSQIESYVRDRGLQECVELPGFHKDPSLLLDDCHFYIQPSLSEGFGLAICEAMSLGIPCIAPRLGGLPEVIEHGTNGWLIDAPTGEDVATAVLCLLEAGKGRLESMGRAANQSVYARFDPVGYMNRCDAMYRSLGGRISREWAQ